MKLTFLLADGETARAEHTACVLIAGAIANLDTEIIGIRTCIDESSVYHADLSSPFFEEAPHPHTV